MVTSAGEVFADRHAAGRELAQRLSGLAAAEDLLVLGLARGGVPVAYEVAQALGAPLDVLVVRKIGAPGNPEYGIGAIAEGGVLVLDEQAVSRLLVSHEELESAIARARDEIAARVTRYRGGQPLPDVEERTVIVITPWRRCCSTCSPPARSRTAATSSGIGLLGRRLVAATRWAQREADLARLPIGYFGASTGAAAALCAAADLGDRVGAVVARGGRPDLAGARLADVHAPVLLIGGGGDDLVLELSRRAQRVLNGRSELAVVPGATHLFEEPGALEEVARLAPGWFTRHLGARERDERGS